MDLKPDLLPKEGKLIVISGPSGTGKGTIVNRVLQETECHFSVSMTTRKPREGEIDGVHYYFVTEEQFVDNIAKDGFFEHAATYGNRYGTPKGPILEKLSKGIDVLLDIEMQGALQVKKAHPDAVLIFVLPPSLAVLRERLMGRGTETKEAVELRLSRTLEEMKYIDDYDYMVVNDRLDDAVETVKAIIRAEHAKITMDADEVIAHYKKEEEN